MNGLFFGENVTGLPCTETLNEAEESELRERAGRHCRRGLS